MNIELMPFDVPDKVYMKQDPDVRQDGFKSTISFDLDKVPVADLDVMCNNFRKAVFAKAGKIDPNFYQKNEG